MALLAAGDAIDDDLSVLRHVASGGMGDVYEAYDRGLGRRVAVKLLRPVSDQDATTPTLRAVREGRATARVVHAGVVAVHRVGRHEGAPYLVIEWIDGPTLRAVLAEPLPRALAFDVLVQTVDAVAAAHAAGVLHCDLKPENILLAPAAAGGARVKVVDFGLARGLGAVALPQKSARLRNGTRAYLPPDAAGLVPSSALDVYALGVLGVELLGSARPPARLPETVEGRAALLERPPLRLPPRLAAVLARALTAPTEAALGSGAFADAGALRPALVAAGRADGLDGKGGASSAGVEDAPRSRAALRAEVQAIFALVDSADVALLAAVFGAEVEAICDSLRASGWLQGALGALSASEPALAALALEGLSTGRRAALCAALAFALEASGRADTDWGLREAVALWARGGRADVAAGRVAERARLSPRLRERERGVARALALLEATPPSSARLALWLERAEDAARAGWADVARDSLAQARAEAAALGLAADAPAARRCRLVEGELRLLAGDVVGARDRFLGAVGDELGVGIAGADAHDTIDRLVMLDSLDDISVLALARALAAAALAALAEGGDRHAVVAWAAPLLRRFGNPPAPTAEALRLAARVREGVAQVAIAAGDLDAALAALRVAAGDDLERGDALDAAGLLLAIAELRCERDPRGAATLADEVAGLLEGQGLLRVTVRLDLLRGRLALRGGDAFAAARHAAVAASRAAALGVALDAVDAAALAGAAAEVLGDHAGAWQARQEHERCQRRLRRWRGDGGVDAGSGDRS